MKNPALILAVLLLTSLGALALFLPMGNLAADTATTRSAESSEPSELGDSHQSLVVLELFTSQGCSSCPPADRLLRKLGQSKDVLALSYHVDYWNYIGWTDPFSSEKWSQRQERYARVLEGGRLYTPQLVVDGRAHVVGSDARAIERLIGEARTRARLGEVTLEASWEESGEVLQVTAGASVGEGAPKMELLLAVVESALETPISRGENDGRTLENDFVVRRLKTLFSVRKNEVTQRIRVEIPPEWKREHLGLVAFLQDPRDLVIYGAVEIQPKRPVDSQY